MCCKHWGLRVFAHSRAENGHCCAQLRQCSHCGQCKRLCVHRVLSRPWPPGRSLAGVLLSVRRLKATVLCSADSFGIFLVLLRLSEKCIFNSFYSSLTLGRVVGQVELWTWCPPDQYFDLLLCGFFELNLDSGFSNPSPPLPVPIS